MNQQEILNSFANRILHGNLYKLFYFVMAILSLICLLTSLVSNCPPPWFYVTEFTVLIAMISEFLLRYYAIKNYFKQFYNVLDALVLGLCLMTFCLIISHSCGDSSKREALFEEIMLVIRNVVQFARLGRMMHR
jgi:hypothetical protein